MQPRLLSKLGEGEQTHFLAMTLLGAPDKKVPRQTRRGISGAPRQTHATSHNRDLQVTMMVGVCLHDLHQPRHHTHY